jgi:hypothetical protein
MKPRLVWFLAVMAGLSVAAGCAAGGPLALNRAAPCPGGVWVSAHRGPTGAWNRGQWRCPDPSP